MKAERRIHYADAIDSAQCGQCLGDLGVQDATVAQVKAAAEEHVQRHHPHVEAVVVHVRRAGWFQLYTGATPRH